MATLIAPMIKDYEQALRDDRGWAMDASPATSLTRKLRDLGRKWAKRFRDRARDMTEQMVQGANAYSHASLGRSLKEMSGGLTIKTPEMPEQLYDRILAATAENVGLIRSIPEQYHDRIESAVLRAVASGGQGAETVFDEVGKIGRSTRDRAKLIADDQVRKVTSAMNTERMKAAGITQVRWIHSGAGKEPRPLHVEYDGQVFDLDDPPVIDERTGERGWVGQLLNCRCKLQPVVDYTRYLNADAG